MRRALPFVVCALAGAAAWCPKPARGADITDVASSFEEHNRFDFRFRVRYDHTEKRAQIKREIEGLSPTQTTVELFKDLTYEYHRDAVALRAEFGLFKDLMLNAELPIIIEEASSYNFDQSAGAGCVFPPQANPNCVNATNSSSVADGIVPATGYDARNNGVALSGGVFRSVLRGARGGSGLDAFDTFNLGLTWAPMSQARDVTKPTWIVMVEGHFSIGNIKAFDRAAPDANHAVSEGVHRLLIRTALSKRFKYFEPYWELWYLLSLPRGDSLYQNYGRAQKSKNPMMQGGSTFGTEIIPFDRPDQQFKLVLDLRGRILGHFNGRGYSEGWELFAGSSALQCDSAMGPFNPACDPTAPQNPYQNKPFTGITTIENYASVGTDIAVAAQVGAYFRLRTGFQYMHDQAHYITGEDIGTPLTGSGRVSTANEFNPAYRPVIDQPGRRYRVDNVHAYNFYLWAQFMF